LRRQFGASSSYSIPSERIAHQELKMKNESILPDEIIQSKIYFLREQKAMLDRDLAALYGVETRVLNKLYEET